MDKLAAIPLTIELLGDLSEFDCGDEEYQRELASWLTVEGPIWLEKGNWIWLFANSAGELVGFGSLGKARWAYPNPTSKKRSVALIPAVAIRRQFWGQPPGPPEERYSSQIIHFLLAQAEELANIEPAVGLFVHLDNQSAIRLYERFGFVRYPLQYIDQTTKVVYQAMLRDLHRPEK